MIRKGIYSLSEIFDKLPERSEIGFKKLRAEFDSDSIKITSDRYYLFRESIECVFCGIKGSFFAKEKAVEAEKSYHFNMYAIDSDGEEVLMTKDHIIPRSKGGKDSLSNYQTCCSKCNTDKGNTNEEEYRKKIQQRTY